MTQEKNLYAIYLGGRIGNCHIEMHDVIFSVGDTIESCYDDVKSKRVGGNDSCHIDAFLILKYVSGYEVVLSDQAPIEQTQKLYFVNAGGYQPEKFGENHEIGFYVAQTQSQATELALQTLLAGQNKVHRDDIYDIDDCISIEKVNDYYIHLIPSTKTQDFQPMYLGYGLLNKNLSEKITHHNF
ncbi:MAG: DUF1543 domain-containing protein [Candidatus Absconditabacterales bacterium]